MITMPKRYPRELRDDVVRVARTREKGLTLEEVAADFGMHAMTLSKWLHRADISAGNRPSTTTEENACWSWHAGGTDCSSGRTKS